ncbi:DUF1350 family protein [Chlorogloeopsis sp. ULAP01]|uniref:DUF1350 family protein n=1 Tax=Chlorogloeopsis sp. ULAP01 TaxID=3056483 RepID=UPI0025AA5336|nr:DUF1350 family protein [Chlorogloeopsis sp. ULAP01]MDM9385591.1 DUF1350 family protein [Chlorogloeopsis sp. ULAP01]
MDAIPEFHSISRSYVAIHPNPKGIVQFIGSFVFGSFPIHYYKSLFQDLFQKGYTIFVYKFPLNPLGFDHWKIAISLLEEQFRLRLAVIQKIIQDGQTPKEELEKYLNNSNYYWLGHSLGCKYIALLEILSNAHSERDFVLKHCLGTSFNKVESDIISASFTINQAVEEIENLVERKIEYQNNFIINQPSLLLAPEISNTAGVENPFLNLFVFPNGSQTRCMITQSKKLFNLTAIISFKSDCIAKDDVSFFIEQLHLRKCPLLHFELEGWHLEPLATENSNLVDYVDKVLETLRKRLLEGCKAEVPLSS